MATKQKKGSKRTRENDQWRNAQISLKEEKFDTAFVCDSDCGWDLQMYGKY